MLADIDPYCAFRAIWDKDCVAKSKVKVLDILSKICCGDVDQMSEYRQCEERWWKLPIGTIWLDSLPNYVARIHARCAPTESTVANYTVLWNS
jgi:hypothetical protein